MTYNLEFDERAFKEWKALDKATKERFKKKLREVLINPKIEKNKLHGSDFKDCYKIKLSSIGFRLVYKVEDDNLIVLVIKIGKRERLDVYHQAQKRLS